MRRHLVLRVVSKMLIPYIMLFGLYVQFHGDFGPGGGFQAGIIFAAAFILYGLVFGVEHGQKILPDRVLRLLAPAGVLIFAGTGFVTMALGGKYLDYDRLAATPAAGQHLGILIVEFGVGVTVFSVMVIIYNAYAGRTSDVDTEDW